MSAGFPPQSPAEAACAPRIGIEEMVWWRALREQGDATARARLLELHLPYARVVAASYYARRTHDEVEFADYLQLARLGLLESLDRFDPEQGAQFRTFAARRMHGAILNGIEHATEKTQQIAARKRVQQERLKAAKAMARERVQATKSLHADALLTYVSEVGIGLAIGILLEGSGMIDGDAFGLQPVPSAEDVYAQDADLRRTNRRLLAAVSCLAEARAASERGEHAQAVAMLRSAATRSGEDPSPWVLLGAELASAGQMAEAELAYANAVLRFPRLAIARFQLGLLQLTGGRLSQAALTWEPLLHAPADDPLRHYVEGFLALAVDDFEAARRGFDLGLQLPQTNEALMADIRKTLAC